MEGVKGGQSMVVGEDLTLGGGHTVQYTDHVSSKCALETCIILLTSATPTHLKIKYAFKEMDSEQHWPPGLILCIYFLSYNKLL